MFCLHPFSVEYYDYTAVLSFDRLPVKKLN